MNTAGLPDTAEDQMISTLFYLLTADSVCPIHRLLQTR